MKELGDAINESLSDSEQISEVVCRIKECGYDIFLVLEATIGVSKQGDKSPDKTSLITTMSSNPELKVSDQDLKFLKSLRIKIDEEHHDKGKWIRSSIPGRVAALPSPQSLQVIRNRISACFPATFLICATINCFFAASAVTLNPRDEKGSAAESEGWEWKTLSGCF